MKKLLLPALLLACSLIAVHAADVFVATDGSDEFGDGSSGAPYFTIDHAYEQAVSGDRILVRAGTYFQCPRIRDFPDKPVELIAEDWLLNQRNDTTVINGLTTCGPATFGFRKATVDLQSSTSRLEGFTIRGGGNSGIRASGSAVITNNVITSNTSFLGGGIYIYNEGCLFGDTTATISNNVIHDNVSTDNGDGFGGDGGGVYVRMLGLVEDPQSPCSPADPVVNVIDNEITENLLDPGDDRTVFGGGIVVFTNTSPGSTATAVISNNLISGNSMDGSVFGYGGGAWITTYGYGNETITITGNEVSDNSAILDGGGMSAWIQTLGVEDSDTHHSVTVANNEFKNNVSESNGGGLDAFVFVKNLGILESVNMVVEDNEISGNSAAGDFGGGGGLLASFFAERSTPVANFSMTRNVVTDNTSGVIGGGIGLVISADADPEPDDPENPPPAILTEATILMSSTLVAGNTASGFGAVGGGIFTFLQAFGAGTALLRTDRMTVADNTTDSGSGGIEIEALTGFDFAGEEEGQGILVIENSIVSDNSLIGVGGSEPGVEEGVMAQVEENQGNLLLSISRSAFHLHSGGNFEPWIGDPIGNPTAGNLDADPLLSDRDFVPDSCSPTLDAGDPIADPGAEPAPNGGRLNMGHTGGTAQATSALGFLDVDGDGNVDGLDILRIAISFGSANGQFRFLPGADLDSNDVIDGNDLAMAIAAFGKTCE